MFDFYGAHFEYAGVSSRQHEIIIASINEDRNLSMGDTLSAITVFNRRGNNNYYIGDDRTESPIEFDVEFVADSDRSFNKTELRAIEKWLFNEPGYRKLYIDDYDDCDTDAFEIVSGDPKRLYLKCRFINPEKIEGNGGICGFKATMQCDSGLAWQDEVTYSYTITMGSASSKSVIVPVDSDLKDYIYPKVTITTGSNGGEITIHNNTDDADMDNPRLTRFVSVPASTSIIMDGNINYINSTHYQRFADKNFIRLLDGQNNISISGDVVSIVFVFSNRRWL